MGEGEVTVSSDGGRGKVLQALMGEGGGATSSDGGGRGYYRHVGLGRRVGGKGERNKEGGTGGERRGGDAFTSQQA